MLERIRTVTAELDGAGAIIDLSRAEIPRGREGTPMSPDHTGRGAGRGGG